MWKALDVVASSELLHGHVRCRGDLRKDRGLGGPSPIELKETGASIRSRDDGDIRLGYRASRQGDRAGRRIRGLFFEALVPLVRVCGAGTAVVGDRGLSELRVAEHGCSQEALKAWDVLLNQTKRNKAQRPLV